MRIVAAIGLGLVLLAGAAPAGAASVPGQDLPSAYGRQSARWGACPPAQKELRKAGARCAKIRVPLDYGDPGGPMIEIAISRVKAKGPRRGILLANPGGPGGTGLAYALSLRPALKGVADRYDLIGFDPRFLGDSTPITCAPGGPQRAPGRSSTARRDFEASVKSARDLARRCRENGDNATLLPHATTRNVARDMDLIRAALGAPKLSYYGVSYGADLGAVYAQLFPRRVDRMVIDSSTDPAATQYELFRRAGRPLEAGLDEWARWAAGRHEEYRLGRTAARVRATVENLVDRAERRPIAAGDTRLGAPVVRLLLRQFVQEQHYDAALAGLVRDLVKAASDNPGKPGPDLSRMLGLLASRDLAASLTGGALFMCGDAGWPAGGWPKDPETYWKNVQRSRAAQPVFGPLVNGMIAPCAFWTRPAGPVTAIGNDVPVLMVQARRDDNVPYAGALALHRRLTGSRLVSADIRAHGVYGRGTAGLPPAACADRAVNAYLAGGPLPERDLNCP
ncbi:alpha/beta hydrolase [Spongiactinospora rosea]|uniref:Alpha/beta hydrolase n=1 Tax=Spongiactinospora rosea TaxID=2248750 RepID=A0A366LU96_9ACTN|nr:alpha/beta hydrolase [Spongiactinospora rosea]RBQ17535.1 alpha/beta hydrolase [Spongiactinospora rosea]